MLRMLVALLILFTLVACSKGAGFRAENFEYQMATPEKVAEPEKVPEYKPGTVVRGAEKVKFNTQPSKLSWNSNNTLLNLKANVIIDGKDLGEVEFEGTKKDSKIILVPKDEKLKDTIKAQVKCLSEDDSCNENYIDVLYKDKGVIYIQQVIQTPKTETKAGKPTDPVKPGTTPQPPKPAEPVKPGTPAKPPEKAENVDKSESFEDIVDAVATAKSGFQGVSDEDAAMIMNQKDGEPKNDKQEPPPGQPVTPVPVPTPAPPPGKPPTNPPKTDTPKTPTPSPAPTPTHNDPVFDQLEKFRAYDQSINYPQTINENGVAKIGRVRNATNFVEVSKIPGIGFLFPPGKTSIYGSFNLATVLAKMGEFMKQILPNKPLHINSIGLFNGGVRPPGASHQNGNDADIRYIRVKDDFEITRDVVDGARVTNNLMLKEQWELIKKTFSTGEVEMVAVDGVVKKALCEQAIRVSDYVKGQDATPAANVLKRIIPTVGHEDHFHVRVRCGIKNPDCKSIKYKDYPVGC